MRRQIERVVELDDMAAFKFWMPIYLVWTAVVVPVVVETVKVVV